MCTFDTRTTSGEIKYACAIFIQAPAEDLVDRAKCELIKHLPHKTIMPCGYEYTILNIVDLPKSDMPCSCGNPEHWFVKYKIGI